MSAALQIANPPVVESQASRLQSLREAAAEIRRKHHAGELTSEQAANEMEKLRHSSSSIWLRFLGT